MNDMGKTETKPSAKTAAKSGPPAAKKALFRAQAIAHKRRALYGEVILKSSVSSWVITALLAVICIAAAAFILIGAVQTETGPISLWQWLSGGGI